MSCPALEIPTVLANMNSRSHSLCYRPSVCRLSVVCLSVTFMHPTQPVVIFDNFSSPFYLGHPLTFTENFTEIVPAKPLRLGV